MGWRGVLRVIELLGRWSPEVSGPAQPILSHSVPGPPPPPLPLMSGTQRGCMWGELPVCLCPGPSDLGRTGPRSLRPWLCPSTRGIALSSPPPREGESPADRAPSGQHPSVSWLHAESPTGTPGSWWGVGPRVGNGEGPTSMCSRAETTGAQGLRCSASPSWGRQGPSQTPEPQLLGGAPGAAAAASPGKVSGMLTLP